MLYNFRLTPSFVYYLSGVASQARMHIVYTTHKSLHLLSHSPLSNVLTSRYVPRTMESSNVYILLSADIFEQPSDWDLARLIAGKAI